MTGTPPGGGEAQPDSCRPAMTHAKPTSFLTFRALPEGFKRSLSWPHLRHINTRGTLLSRRNGLTPGQTLDPQHQAHRRYRQHKRQRHLGVLTADLSIPARHKVLLQQRIGFAAAVGLPGQGLLPRPDLAQRAKQDT